MSDKITGTSSGTGYCKMPDGTLICYGAVSASTVNSGGKFGYYGTANITFPVAFNSAPMITVNVKKGAAFWNATADSISATGAEISIAGDAIVTATVEWLAIGRWK